MKIVVADDSAVIRKIIEKSVASLGYETLHAGNGQMALELLEKNSEDVALVILDWNMPVVNGFEVLKSMKEDSRFGNIPVLMVSTESEEAKIGQVSEAGANGYLSKPFKAEELVLYTIYYRYEDAMYRNIVNPSGKRGRQQKIAYFDHFKKDVAHFLDVPAIQTSERHTAENLHALLFQYRRAFHFTFRKILGSSMPISKLRAAVWESVFTFDMRRYWRSFLGRMHDMGTLITGPSGTGKELVASAIGLSQYIPFDETTEQFKEDFRDTFHPINLSALSPNLIESELFGHKKGSFTGATSDRAGYLEGKGECHTVFLDEIGDVNVDIQLKLLRVLQTREFSALGDCVHRHFGGKIVAATNRDLVAAIEDGTFRSDLYYRLCSDHIVTPSLREQVADDPEEFSNLVASIASRIVGEQECEPVTEEVMKWIDTSLGPNYPWPGNIRELEQCIRNVVVHGEYRPLSLPKKSPQAQLTEEIEEGGLTADDLVSRYCTLVYAKTGQYQEVARRLGLDRRTVKAKIDEKLLRDLEED